MLFLVKVYSVVNGSIFAPAIYAKFFCTSQKLFVSFSGTSLKISTNSSLAYPLARSTTHRLQALHQFSCTSSFHDFSNL